MTRVFTYAGDEHSPALVGVAYANFRRRRLSSTFAYEQGYLASEGAWQIDPELELRLGNWPLAGELPGSFLDATPDRWGRNLIQRRFPGKSLSNLDYLLQTSDISRQGALRFKTEAEGEFQHPLCSIPKLIALPQLLQAARSVNDRRHGEEACRYLLDAGTASLGGARPKAVVEDNGKLYLAKFPHSHDEHNVIADEYKALAEARKRGIDAAACSLVKVGGDDILLLERFDRGYGRSQARRIGYISAMTALAARDGEQRDYLEMLAFISRHGSRPKDDAKELLRRVRYFVEINNTDDHLRNHGFLREKGGWRLSPAFDINPDPSSSTQRQTSFDGAVTADATILALDRFERENIA
jgi:serine/threonine-protein kinase HipA